MTKRISKEIRNRIHYLHQEGRSVKEILYILNGDNVVISDKTIYRIIKENKENKEKNVSFISFNESFTDEFEPQPGILNDVDSFTDIKEVNEEIKEEKK